MRESVAAHPHFALRPGAFRPEGRRGRSLPPEGQKKAVDFGRKPHCFRPKTANFFRCVHHFCTDRAAFGREKAHSGAKKVISLHLLSLKSGKVAPRERQI